MKEDKGLFDLKQRQIQRSYREKVNQDHDHTFFLFFIGCFISGSVLLAIASFIYNSFR